MKNINYISMHGEKFYQCHTETTSAVATLKNFEKMDPLDIERTHNIGLAFKESDVRPGNTEVKQGKCAEFKSSV